MAPIVDVNSLFGQRGYQLVEKIEDGSEHNVYVVSSGKPGQKRNVRIAEYKLKDKNQAQRMNWTKLNHPNVLKLHEHFDHKKWAYFVYENCAKKPVSHHFDEQLHRLASPGPGKGREPLAKRWTIQCLRALKHCNELGLYHHDFNFGDVWVDENKDAKIANFDRMHSGANKRVKTDPKTANYRSPEATEKRRCACFGRRSPRVENSQIWALGASLLELLTGSSIAGRDFRLNDDAKKTKKSKDLIKSNVANLPNFLAKTDLSEECKNFLKRTLAYEAKDRPTVENAIQHPWFLDVDLQRPLAQTPQESSLQERPKPMDTTCTARVFNQVNVGGNEGFVGASSCVMSTIDAGQEASKDTFHSVPSTLGIVPRPSTVKTDPFCDALTTYQKALMPSESRVNAEPFHGVPTTKETTDMTADAIKVTEMETREFFLTTARSGSRGIQHADRAAKHTEDMRLFAEVDITVDNVLPSVTTENMNKAAPDMEVTNDADTQGEALSPSRTYVTPTSTVTMENEVSNSYPGSNEGISDNVKAPVADDVVGSSSVSVECEVLGCQEGGSKSPSRSGAGISDNVRAPVAYGITGSSSMSMECEIRESECESYSSTRNNTNMPDNKAAPDMEATNDTDTQREVLSPSRTGVTPTSTVTMENEVSNSSKRSNEGISDNVKAPVADDVVGSSSVSVECEVLCCQEGGSKSPSRSGAGISDNVRAPVAYGVAGSFSTSMENEIPESECGSYSSTRSNMTMPDTGRASNRIDVAGTSPMSVDSDVLENVEELYGSARSNITMPDIRQASIPVGEAGTSSANNEVRGSEEGGLSSDFVHTCIHNTVGRTEITVYVDDEVSGSEGGSSVESTNSDEAPLLFYVPTSSVEDRGSHEVRTSPAGSNARRPNTGQTAFGLAGASSKYTDNEVRGREKGSGGSASNNLRSSGASRAPVNYGATGTSSMLMDYDVIGSEAGCSSSAKSKVRRSDTGQADRKPSVYIDYEVIESDEDCSGSTSKNLRSPGSRQANVEAPIPMSNDPWMDEEDILQTNRDCAQLSPKRPVPHPPHRPELPEFHTPAFTPGLLTIPEDQQVNDFRPRKISPDCLTNSRLKICGWAALVAVIVALILFCVLHYMPR